MKTSSRVVTETPKLVIPYSSSLSMLLQRNMYIYYFSKPTKDMEGRGIEHQLQTLQHKRVITAVLVDVLIHMTVLH